MTLPQHTHLTAASLFSGCGGLDLGFLAEGFELVYSCDSDASAVAIHARNLGSGVIQRDVREESFLRDLNGLPRIDVVLGGFPCQGFSKAGPKNEQDARNVLYERMVEAVRILRPMAFVAENVDGLSQNFAGAFLARIRGDFERIGYQVETKLLDAVSYGAPQHRRRIFFVGSRTPGFTWPRCTHLPRLRDGESPTDDDMPLFRNGGKGLAPPVTLGQAIGDLVSVGIGELPDHRIVDAWPKRYEHIFRAIGEGQKLCNVRHSDTSVYTWTIPKAFGTTTQRERIVLDTIARHRRHKKYGDIPNGNPLPVAEIQHLSGLEHCLTEIEALLAKGYLKQLKGGVDLKGAMFCSGLFKRPRWGEPSPTVLTNFHNPRYFLHPSANRPFTLRECARLQGFPDDFVFSEDTGVSLVDGYRLVGNAVPSYLSKPIARAVRMHLAHSAVGACR
jgi:DNA (cytosine-5)-methyltransferase 1